jgi:Transcriptional regulator of heat shock gene
MSINFSRLFYFWGTGGRGYLRPGLWRICFWNRVLATALIWRNPRRINCLGPKTGSANKTHRNLCPCRLIARWVVLVFANGHVENRIFTPPIGQTPSSLREAAKFLNSIMQGHTLSEAQQGW